MEDKRETAPRTPGKAEGEREPGDAFEDRSAAPITPGSAEGERDRPEDEGQS